MSRSYLPVRDSLLDPWLLNFSTLITASPGTYGLVAGDAVAIAGYYSTWHAAYLLAHDPATRTKVTVKAKDDAKAAITPPIRVYAVQIKNDLGVADADKVALGINPPNNSRAPVPAPVSFPELSITGSSQGQTGLRYHDSALGQGSRAKPAGAVAIELYRGIADDVVADPLLMEFVGLFTKTPMTSNTTAADSGRVASYCGRWVTRKGLFGPWGPIVSGFLT